MLNACLTDERLLVRRVCDAVFCTDVFDFGGCCWILWLRLSGWNGCLDCSGGFRSLFGRLGGDSRIQFDASETPNVK